MNEHVPEIGTEEASLIGDVVLAVTSSGDGVVVRLGGTGAQPPSTGTNAPKATRHDFLARGGFVAAMLSLVQDKSTSSTERRDSDRIVDVLEEIRDEVRALRAAKEASNPQPPPHCPECAERGFGHGQA